MDKLALRPSEVADALGVSRSRVYQLIASGELPSIYIGGMRRVAVEQLREWVARKSDARRVECVQAPVHVEPRPDASVQGAAMVTRRDHREDRAQP